MMGLLGKGIVLGVQQVGYGYIEWNLPGQLQYQPGEAIPMVLRVSNPSAEAREYQLYLGLFDPETRELIPDTMELIQVNGGNSFTVAGGSYIEMEGEVAVGQSNVILALLLYDVASDTVPSHLEASLVAPGAGLELTPLWGGMFALAAVGMMVPLITDVFREEK
jgi:hypothetical protein